MKNFLYFAAAALIVSGLWLDIAVGDAEAVVSSNLQWNCSHADGETYCEVSFEIVNTTSAPQVRRVSVRGVRLTPDKNDANAPTCGQIIFSILLEPGETIAIRERMPVVAIPDKITVSIRE